MSSFQRFIWFVLVVSVFFVPPAMAATKDMLVLGKVSMDPKKHYRALRPIVDYVVSKMGDLGITRGEVLLAKDDRQMASYLRQHKIDWVTETPFAAVYYHQKAGAEYLLRRWKKGVPEYSTIFFVRKDSGINSLSDLVGKTIAFEDPGSTSAYFMPAATLIGHGLELVMLGSPREKPVPGKVGYVFSKQEINSSTWVHKHYVDSAALSDLDWDKDDHMPLTFREDMKIIHQTRSFPRAVEVVRKELDKKIKLRLKKVLLNAHNDPEARKALRAFQKTAKFDELDDQMLQGLDEVAQLRKIVEEALL